MSIKKRLIHFFLKNEYTSDTQQKFHKWFMENSNEENDQILFDYWNSLSKKADSSTLKSLSEVENKLQFNKSNTHTSRYFFITKIAAVLIIIFFILSGIFIYRKSDSKETIQITYKEAFAENGEIKTIYLSDSTKVVLNSGSLIIYPETAQQLKERSVYLQGEAYFEVTHIPNSTFIVKTEGVDIAVLGTKFNVSAYTTDNDIITTLKAGSVRLDLGQEKKESLLMVPYDQVVYNKKEQSFIKTQIDKTEDVALWRDGHLVFKKASIHEVLRSLEQRYGIDIYLNSNRYESDRLTAKFIHGETLIESLQIIEKIVPGLRYKLEENKLYIY